MNNSRAKQIEMQGKQLSSQKVEMSSAQILQAVKKRPYSQMINGVEYTFSILNKKQQTFVLTHQRFLVLKGIQSISYARQFPQHKSLPFTSVTQIPHFKFSFKVAEIETFTNEQQRLIITFSGKDKVKWQFVCPTKVCALQWRKKLDKATKLFRDFQQSRFNKLEDYLENKKKQEAMKYDQFSQMKSLMGSAVSVSEPNLYIASQSETKPPNTQSIQNQNFKNSPQTPSKSITNKQQPPIVFTNNYPSQPNNQQSPNESKKIQQTNISKGSSEVKKNEDHLMQLLTSTENLSSKDLVNDKTKDVKPFVNYIETTLKQEQEKKAERPKAILFEGSQIAKVQNFIIDNKIQQSLLDRSMTSIPIDQKQNMKLQILKMRRDWIEQLIIGEQETQLLIDFRNYAQRVAQIIINQLYVPQEHKMFPVHTTSTLNASYLLEDLQIQIYFYSQQHLIDKNPKYKDAVLQFKNFDYLIGVLRNQGILRVPLMVLFQYKGFLGMAKSRIGQSTLYKNKELYEILDRRQFERQTRISASVLLNENKCKIISYQNRNQLSKIITQDSQIYFIDSISQLLPNEVTQKTHLLLRPEFVQDQDFQQDMFRDQNYQIKPERINDLISYKISSLVKVLQSGQDYFTNSKEFSEIMHYYGLNVRHIGAIYKMVKYNWLKKILQAQMAARCAKNFYRLDLQNSVLANIDKINNKQRQLQRERNRVISFLNIIFGNTETTFRLWRGFNNAAIESYGTKIWQNEFTDINIPYFLQAIQSNFKIVLANSIHDKKLFKNMNSFQPKDFIRFQFESKIYDLEFTDLFDQIHQCLQEQTLDSFRDLCQVLVREARNRIPYLQLLKNHPIHDKISQFLLNFTSPQENQELYRRIQAKNHPSRFTYESKLAQIKWYLKQNQHEKTYKPASFLEQYTKKWLGNIHPLYTQLHHVLAEFFAQFKPFYKNALKHAQSSLQMQKLLFEGDCEALWKDYFLIGKIHYQNNSIDEALKPFLRAKQLVKVQNLIDLQVYSELNIALARCFITLRQFKTAYSTAKDLYNTIREQREQKGLDNIIQSVNLIKQLLQFNQEHESFYRFIEGDFSLIIGSFTDYPSLMHTAIKMIAIPYLKNVVLNNSSNRNKILMIIDKISKIPQHPSSCLSYLRAKISEGVFPRLYLNCLKEIDAVIEEIERNEMLERWINFNKLANDSLLEKISTSQVYRGFEFLANLTALLHLLGEEVQRQLFFMER